LLETAVDSTDYEAETSAQRDKSKGPAVGRVVSVDALRGFDMFWIIGGGRILRSLHEIFQHPVTEGINKQLSHVKWEGFGFRHLIALDFELLRFQDLIMPLFLFVVGVVMPFSFNKRIAAGGTKVRLYGHIIKRTMVLFVLGMIAQGHLLEYDPSKLHIFSNTLQAIAAGYFIAAVIMLHLRFIWQMAATVVLLLLFWGLMMLVAVPGHGAGILEPDVNLAIYVDRIILGTFIDGTDPPYTWILSSITFACTVMLGVMAGHLLRSKNSGRAKVLWLLAAGAGCVLAGLIWDYWFPIIKHVWTSSFVLVSGGISCLLLALFYLVIDVWGFKKWAFGFVVIGMNAIAVYMATRLFDFGRIGDIFVRGLDRWCGPWTGFVHAVAGFGVVWLILWWMYRRRSFIKI